MSSNYFAVWTEEPEGGRGTRIHQKRHIGLNRHMVRFQFRAYIDNEARGHEIRSWADWRLFLTSGLDIHIVKEETNEELSLTDFIKLIESTRSYPSDTQGLGWAWKDGEGWWFVPTDFD